jgi:hypothetical protein
MTIAKPYHLQLSSRRIPYVYKCCVYVRTSTKQSRKEEAHGGTDGGGCLLDLLLVTTL